MADWLTEVIGLFPLISRMLIRFVSDNESK